MPQQTRSPKENLIFVCILIFIFWRSPNQGGPPGFISPHDYAAERIERTRHALDVLNSTKYQNFKPKSATPSPGESSSYLNLTGFRKEDDYAWERLDTFRSRSEELGKEAKREWRAGKDGNSGLEGVVYENVTGIVKGRWTRYTADLKGEGRKRNLNLTETSPDIDWMYRDPEYWARNITGTEGDLMLNVRDLEGDTDDPKPIPGPLGFIRGVRASMSIQDETSSGDGWEVVLHGVHWPKAGIMYMATTSEKFAGIFGLPHMTTEKDLFTTSQEFLNRTLEKRTERMEESLWRDIRNPWSSTPESPDDATNPTPHCDLVVFVQVQPIRTDQPKSEVFELGDVIDRVEKELRYPTGAPIPDPPRLEMSTVIFSPDCGFMLESKGPPTFSPVDCQHLVGEKKEVFVDDVHKWLNGLALVVFAQIMLLKIQSKEASTPSTVGRVSMYTMGLMLLADALLFATMSLLTTVARHLFPSPLLVSFMALMCVGFGVKFTGVIYQVQQPERQERTRAQAAARVANVPVTPAPIANPAPIITAAGADIAPPPSVTVPVPPTAPVPATQQIPPIIIPSDQDVDAEIAEATYAAAAVPLLPIANRPPPTQPPPQPLQTFGAVYAKFVFTIMIILFFSLSAHGWSKSWRSGYTNLICFVYLSFWLPQIYRNVVRNCRKALLWKFIIGQSLLRLLPIAYFYLYHDNILFADNDWIAFSVLAGWSWLQIWILAAQEVLGPRWGLPKTWYDEGWNYHPVLREDNVEAGGLPIGLVQLPSSPVLERTRTGDEEPSGRKKDGHSNIRTVDCAICMQILEVPVVAAGEADVGATAAVAGILARRLYMVTPCRHVFHSACLEGWMRHRLQCPICRESLPPL